MKEMVDKQTPPIQIGLDNSIYFTCIYFIYEIDLENYYLFYCLLLFE